MKLYFIITFFTFIFMIIISSIYPLNNKPLSILKNIDKIDENNNQIGSNDKKNVSDDIFSCDNAAYSSNNIDNTDFYTHYYNQFFKNTKLDFQTGFFRLYQSENLNTTESKSIKQKMIKLATYIKTFYPKVNLVDQARMMLHKIQKIRKKEDRTSDNISLSEFSSHSSRFFCMAKNSQYYVFPCIILNDNHFYPYRDFYLIKGGIIKNNRDDSKNETIKVIIQEDNNIKVGYADIYDIWHMEEMFKYEMMMRSLQNKNISSNKNNVANETMSEVGNTEQNINSTKKVIQINEVGEHVNAIGKVKREIGTKSIYSHKHDFALNQYKIISKLTAKISMNMMRKKKYIKPLRV